MKKNIKIILYSIVSLIVAMGIFSLVIYIIQYSQTNPWLVSLITSLVFVLVVLGTNFSWKRYGVYLVCLGAFIGVSLDLTGNPLYNQPLEWLFNNANQHFEILQHTFQYGSTIETSYDFVLINNNGEVIETVNFFWIFLFRFFQYLIINSLLLTILDFIRKPFGILDKKWLFIEKGDVNDHPIN